MPAPYVDLSRTTSGPFVQTSTAEDVTELRDLGKTRMPRGYLSNPST